MQCIKCKKPATCIIPVSYHEIKNVYACIECVEEVKKDFNLSLIHHDNEDTIFVNRIHKKYGI